MKILGKNKAFQESFFNLQKMPTYMPAFHKTPWFLTDNKENFEKYRDRTTYSADDVEYQFNRHGFRSIEFVHDAEAINVLIVGESNSIGVGLPFGDIWFNQLGAALKERYGFDNVKFFNMSVSAITLDMMAIMINQVYDVLKPDFVIVIGTSFLASSYFLSEDRDKSTDFLHFSLTSELNPSTGRITPDLSFMPPEIHGIANGFTRELNLANCFFKSLFAYSFIKRICQKNFLIYFRNPKVYNINLENEISQYDQEFSNHFLNFDSHILSPASCQNPNFARDGIHVGKKNHQTITNVVLNKLIKNGEIEKWKQKLNKN